jgi:4-hydroxy-tetrahydrodipicolinate synthase
LDSNFQSPFFKTMKSDLGKLKNAFTALITPFDQDEDLCKETFRNFVRKQIKAGVGLVPVGTTGESATLSHQEHESVIRWCIEEADAASSRPFVLAGTGSNSTKEALSLAIHAERMGVDGLLMITPYYNKPTQKGLIAHYSEIAKSVAIPIVIYNCPGRTGGNILPDTVAELAHKFDNIIGYKAAEGKLEQTMQVIEKCPKNFIVMSGDDGFTYDIMKIGGKGVISVASNIIPDRIQKFAEMMTAGKWDEAAQENQKLQNLFKILFIETNPGPVKFAAELLGLMNRRVRLPLVPPEPENQDKIRKVLLELGFPLSKQK